MKVPAALFVVLLAWCCMEVSCAKNKPSGKVNKGEPDEEADHPWVVRVVTENETLCQGTLINENFILLSARCVNENRGMSRESYEVIVGDYRVRQQDWSEDTYSPAEAQEYPTFDPRTGRNNLALVRLAKPVKFSASVQPVQRLATKYEESRHVGKDSECVIVGWGDKIKNRNRRRKNLILSYLDVDLVDDSNCEEFEGFNRKTDVCYQSGQGGPCDDEGAPIMCMRQKKWALVGIHTGGHNCRAGYYYGTAIAPFRNWIRVTSQDRASKYPSFYLVTKWRTWFMMLNTNGDKKIDMQDADISADLFQQRYELSPFRVQMVLSGYRLWYNQCALNWKAESVNMTQFIDEMMHQYMTDRRGFMKRADKTCMEPYFVWLDENLDGFMTLEEFEKAFIAWNLMEEYHVIRLFNYLGPVDGKLPIATCMSFFDELLTDDDKLSRSTVMMRIVREIIASRDDVLLAQPLEREPPPP